MIVNHKKLIGLRTETENGDYLGKVCGIELDVFNHQVVKYEIKTTEIISAIFGKHLLVSPNQVVEINNKKMIVKNELSGEKELNENKKINPLKKATPLVN